MKRTLLDLTQSILSSLNSDEVNSFSDTTESLQVAEIIRTTYFNMLTRYQLPLQRQLFRLSPTNTATPVLMTLPAGTKTVEWIHYTQINTKTTTAVVNGHNTTVTVFTSPTETTVSIIPLEDFLRMTDGFNTDDSNVDTFTLSLLSQTTETSDNYNFNYKNDIGPRFCTILQNNYVIFDSYDGTLEATLQQSKAKAYGEVVPVFNMQDNFVPYLDESQFPLLLNEAKALAFFELKQMPHPKADKEISRQTSSLQKLKSVAERPSNFNALPNFGRK